MKKKKERDDLVIAFIAAGILGSFFTIMWIIGI